MKSPTFLILCFIVISTILFAQDPSAIADYESTTQGILIPRMTQAQRNLIPSPATGLLVYQLNAEKGFWFFNGTLWVILNDNTVSANLEDADGDTKVQAEENPDEDRIRFDVRGFQAMIVDSNRRIGIGTNKPNELLDARGNILIRNPAKNGALILSPSIGGYGVHPELVIQSAESGGGANAPFHISRNAVYRTNDDSYHYIDIVGKQASQIEYSLNGDLLFKMAPTGTGPIAFTENMRIRNTDGYVGIATNNPMARLHVQGGGLLVDDTIGTTPVSGAGTRLMWVPEKAAFRAGLVDSTEWDDGNIGAGSFVGGGRSNIASGYRTSTVGGYRITASGFYSNASGGNSNTASGGYAFVGAGAINLASGDYSFVGGGGSDTASGTYSVVAGGQNNKATATWSMVGGGQDNTASHVSAFVGGGGNNTASGAGAFIGGGSNNIASGIRGFVAGGFNNECSGGNSFAGGGFNNIASGSNTFVGGGAGLLARSFGEVVFGFNNTDYTPDDTSGFDTDDRLFVIGNGTSSSNRSNALTILKSGMTGIGRIPSDNLLEVEGSASKSSAGDWLANSDARLKTNIHPLDASGMLTRLLSLQGITYEWADDKTGTNRPEGIQYGFTAQNIREVFPTLVMEDNLGYLQTAYGTYDAMYVEAIRALNEKIETLTSANVNLHAENESMNDRLTALETEIATIRKLLEQ